MSSKIITQNELAKEELVNNLLKKVPQIEKKVFDEIMTFIDSFDTVGGSFSNGILSFDDLSEISLRIDDVLRKSGYISEVEVFMKDMGKITVNSALLLDDEGYAFKKLPLSDIEKKWKQKTSETLLNSGLRQDFKQPILNILDDAISYGSGVTTTRKTLEDFVMGGNEKSGKLKSYLTVTARDSIGQLQGQQLQSVGDAVGYEGVSYVGGLLKDSRGQCTHWINDLKGFIPKEKLEYEIKLAYKNQEKKLVEGPHKWGGMMPNTTPNNFIIKKGGFGCTHTAIPKRKK
jgi:ribosomal protein S8